ncbi:GNAT family N-acetyltransferase [Bacillus sp. Bva_UNVM-123]|uniref:GNAT family N-acetyltransferase n=1 Tax=Bacillus sp. Bva_UNVM-123 TaxID=2829798 RepID=UPI00391F9B85
MEIIYETNRLYLSVFDVNHLDSLKELWGSGEVMALCNGTTPHDVIPQVINGYRKCYQLNGLSVYAVIEKETNEFIGAAGFNITSTLDNIELIYHFNKRSWGKGFATEAASACLEMAKKHGKVKMITASADPQNAGSLKILEKIGFAYKGTKWFEDTKQEEPYYEYKL